MSRRARITLWAAGTALVLAAVGLTVLPIAAARVIEGLLRERGADQVSIDDMDINLFTGKVELDGVVARGATGELTVDRLEVGFTLWPLLSRRLEVLELRLGNTHLDLADRGGDGWHVGPVRIEAASEVEPAVADDDAPWGVGVHSLVLNDVSVSLATSQLARHFSVESLSVAKALSWQPEQPLEIAARLRTGTATISFDGQATPFDEVLDVTGRIRLLDMALQSLEAPGLQDSFDALHGNIGADLTFEMSIDQHGGSSLNAKGTLGLTDFRAVRGDRRLAASEAGWDGELGAVLQPANASQGAEFSLRGELGVSGIELATAAESARVDTIRWQGEGAFNDADHGLTAALEGILEFGQLLATARGARANAEAIRWQGRAELETQIDGDPRLDAGGSLTLVDVGVGEQRDEWQLVRLARLSANDMRLTADRATISELDLSDLEVWAQRLPDGDLRLPFDPATNGAAQAPAADEPAKSSGAASLPEQPAPVFALSVATLSLSGRNVVHVRDESVEPSVSADVVLDELLARDLNTAGEAPLTLTFVGRTSETDRLKIEGTLSPFTSTPSADLAVDLDGFDLSKISSYLPGYNIERGRISIAGRHRVRDGKLDLQNNVVIERLSLAGKSADDKPLLASGAAMPLDVMLDLLRDRDGRIEVDIPVSGDLTNIDVGLNQLFRQATQAALQKAAFAYVKNALQPLGSILFAANLAGKLSRPRFEPVSFAPGEADVTGEQARYVDKLGALLAERPELNLTLCGVASEADRLALTPSPEPAQATTPEGNDAENVAPPGALPSGSAPKAPTSDAPSPAPAPSTQDTTTLVTQETLLTLARARADAVKQRLGEADGVEAAQLFDCRPSLDTDPDGAARVELTL